jgi:hypothetical protein
VAAPDLGFLSPTYSPIWLIFAVWLLLMISATLDHAWGPFKVNLYIFGGVIFMIVGAMFFHSPAVGFTLEASIFLACAVIAPEYELLLFFILPVKMKWLAAILGAGLLLMIIDTPGMGLPILFSLLNFFIAFGPRFVRWLKLRGTVVERRARFDAAKAPEGTWIHRCHACGKTDLDDPKLDFRVGADGEDYCNVCREKKMP